MMDLVVLVVGVGVARTIDYDDEMKNIGMENRDLVEDDQDLLEMIDNFYRLVFFLNKNSKFKNVPN